eukprot:185463-Rhodomonas_salina.1
MRAAWGRAARDAEALPRGGEDRARGGASAGSSEGREERQGQEKALKKRLGSKKQRGERWCSSCWSGGARKARVRVRTEVGRESRCAAGSGGRERARAAA